MRFSASTLSFYPEDIEYSNLPIDCIYVDDSVFQYIINAPIGKVRSVGIDGNPILIDLPEPEPLSVTRITRAQGKRQLVKEGFYDTIKTSVDTDPEHPEMIRIGFYDEDYWIINDPFVQAFKAALGLTDEKLQQMFNDAGKL